MAEPPAVALDPRPMPAADLADWLRILAPDDAPMTAALMREAADRILALSPPDPPRAVKLCPACDKRMNVATGTGYWACSDSDCGMWVPVERIR